MLQHQRRHLIEQGFFQRQRLFARFGDAAGQGRQFVGGKARRARHGLAMTEQILIAISLSACCWRHFDEITQHAIMLDAAAWRRRCPGDIGFPARR